MKLFGKNLDTDIVIIAEIGVNHEGSIDSAMNLIRLAHESGADAVKFQSYTPEKFIASNDKERMKRVKNFHLDESDHLKLITYAANIGIPFFSTAVTEDWIPFLNNNTNVIKIASGDITFEPTIRAAAKTEKPVILSTGGANMQEIRKAIGWFEESSKNKEIKNKLILMHCISAYPASLEGANLNSIKFLQEQTGLYVGYSNHVKGILAPVVSIALGASLIEVHFTDSRDDKIFHDHHLSLVPSELKELSISASNIKKSLGSYDKFCSEPEKNNLLALRKGIIAAHDIPKGQVIEKKDLMYARPSNEIDSSKILTLLGKKPKCNIERGQLINYNILE